MRQLLLAVLLLATAHALSAQTEATGPVFRPAEPVSVTGVRVPFFCDVNGVVILNAVINDTGKLERVGVLRSIPCLNELALKAVGKWKFRPATWGENPVGASVPVAITFRPPGQLTSRVAFPDAGASGNAGASPSAKFHPAQVIYAEYPDYPLTSIVAGTVILEVKVTEEGKADTVKVLRDLPPLTDAATAVVKSWRFSPATYDGSSVASEIILAFVSQPLVVTPH